jgi:ABC-type transport system substrate-binding protein
MLWSKPGPQQDALQAMLGQIGIKTKYRIIDAATVIDELYRKANYDISFGNFSADQDLKSVWKYIKGGWGYDQGGFNYARYNDKEIDGLWEKGIAERDDKKRRELFDQITLLLDKKPPQATLWRISINYVWNKRVKGAWPYQYRRPARPALEKVWIQK